MRRVFFIFLCAFSVYNIFAQEIKQDGVAYQYNGKNPKTALPNVSVHTNASPAISGNNGSFVLTFKQTRMGDPIRLVLASKNGYVLFNKEETQSWSVKRAPLRLVMCDAATYNKMRSANYDRILANMTKRHELEENRLKSKLAQHIIKENDYRHQIDSISKLYDNSLAKIDEYTDEYTRIDESELDSIMSKAKQLFDESNVEEGLKVLESSKAVDKYIKALDQKDKAQAQIDEGVKKKAEAVEDSAKLMTNIQSQITMLKSYGQYDKVKSILKELADKKPTYNNMYNYAFFCQKQNDFNESEKYYKVILVYLHNDSVKEGTKLANIFNCLGYLYENLCKYEESEKYQKEAMEIFKRLSLKNPDVYEPGLGESLRGLGILYSDLHKYEESEKYYKESLEIRRRLSQKNPDANEPDLAMSLNNLGNLYSNLHKYEESEKYYKESLEIRRRQSLKNLDANEPDLATTLHNLGYLYSFLYKYEESEKYQKEAMEIFKRLSQKNPDAYEPDLAASLNNLGILYSDLHKYEESEKCHKKTMEIYQILSQRNPE